MALFGIGKDKSAPPPPPPSPAARKPANINPDDFFGDLDKKATVARKAAAIKSDIETPEVKGLREAPLPAPECTINNLSTATLSTDNLRDKAAEYDGLYHGNMGDIDESKIDVGTLRPPMEIPEGGEEEE